MAEFNKNLWAPWRRAYMEQLGNGENDGCFLCEARDMPDKDAETFVVHRGESSFVILNRFPYTSGHLLISPYEHTGDIDRLSDETMLEMTKLIRWMRRALAAVLGAEGFNVGINLGRCAGAGLPGHLHWHVVPRWSGDANFVTVLGDVRVIPEDMPLFYDKLQAEVARQKY